MNEIGTSLDRQFMRGISEDERMQLIHILDRMNANIRKLGVRPDRKAGLPPAFAR